jgi:hypothetical protein
MEILNCFTNHFCNKIGNILNDVNINDDVYNGVKKVEALNKNSMDLQYVKECIASLKIKNTEGFNKIPQSAV